MWGNITWTKLPDLAGFSLSEYRCSKTLKQQGTVSLPTLPAPQHIRRQSYHLSDTKYTTTAFLPNLETHYSQSVSQRSVKTNILLWKRH